MSSASCHGVWTGRPASSAEPVKTASVNDVAPAGGTGLNPAVQPAPTASTTASGQQGKHAEVRGNRRACCRKAVFQVQLENSL